MECHWGGLGNEISVSLPSVRLSPNHYGSAVRSLGESGVVCVEISLPGRLVSDEEFGNRMLESVDGLEKMDAVRKQGTKLRSQSERFFWKRKGQRYPSQLPRTECRTAILPAGPKNMYMVSWQTHAIRVCSGIQADLAAMVEAMVPEQVKYMTDKIPMKR